MALQPALLATLKDIAAVMALAEYPWWVIASGAVALHGADAGEVRDVDVLIDLRDVEHVFAHLGLEPQCGTGDDLFRSQIFATWRGSALPVELFAGFELCEQGRWSAVELSTREAIPLDGQAIWVPSRAELHGLLRRFGRPKDLARAAKLSPSGPFPSRSESA